MKSFKQFSQNMDQGYDWGTDKAANHAAAITPGQSKTKRPVTKHYIEIMGKRKRIVK
jgi:hypothetical protein